MSAAGEKVDFRRVLPELYDPRNRDWELVEVPELAFMMVDGEGDPNTSPRYAAAVGALYSVAYPLKFASRRELGRDYVVPPLEGQWYADDATVFESRDKSAFRWTMMIMQPEWVTPAMFEDAVACRELRRRRTGAPPTSPPAHAHTGPRLQRSPPRDLSG